MQRWKGEMSVNVGQRNVPDTPSNRQLGACQKALDLALHTIKICSNENIFDVKYRLSLTDSIIDCAKQIYLDVWTGNNIYVQPDNGRWPERERLQIDAIAKCKELIGLINLARRLFHLKGQKVNYWIKMTVETYEMISKWHEANRKQYGI